MTRLLFLLLILPVAAKADIACTFTTECLPAEPCQDTAYEATITEGGDQKRMFLTDAGRFEVSDPFITLADVTGTLPVIAMQSDNGIAWAGASALGFHMLSIMSDGASYSVHMPGMGGAITYQGSCDSQ